MERLIVIDDKNCKKELERFLKQQRRSIKVDTETNNIAKNLGLLCNMALGQQKQEHRILINAANTSILVKINDIVRCQSNRNYTELYLQNGNKIIVTKALKQFAELPALSSFARIHLSHLVNINYIDRFIKTDGGSLLLTNGTQLPVSKRRRDEWLKKLEII